MEEKTFIMFKDKNGNLVGDVIPAFYSTDCDNFVVYGEYAGRYTWDDVAEVDENGSPLEYNDIPDDATFRLTPLSCFAVSLEDSNIVDDGFAESERKNFRNAYYMLEKWFAENGYVRDSSGNKTECAEPKKPEHLFRKVLNVYYPHANEDQKDVAWEMFIKNMKFQGNLYNGNNEERSEKQ